MYKKLNSLFALCMFSILAKYKVKMHILLKISTEGKNKIIIN